MLHIGFHLRQRRLYSLIGVMLMLAGCSAAGAPVNNTGPSVVAAQPSVAPASSAAPAVGSAVPAPSSAPSQVSSAAASTAVPTPGGSTATTQLDSTGAVQAILDYFRAINDRTYDRAYALWANDGAASGQSFDQFQQGYANTVRVTLQFGAIEAADGQVTVPITLTSIINDPTTPTAQQLVKHFAGTYTLAPAATNDWRIARANIAESSGNDQPSAAFKDPVKLVQAYYDAINRRALAQAYVDWNNLGQSSRQSFAQFKQGFATTDRISIALGRPQGDAGAGSVYTTVPIVISATETDGATQSFCGSYTLRSSNIPPFDQLGWRLEAAQIAASAPVAPDSQQAQQLLNNGCQP